MTPLDRLRLAERGIVVTAHPDDETLWFAGMMLRHRRHVLPWRVLCCSIPIRDPIRAFKFYDACRVLGAIGEVMPFQEGGKNAPLAHLDLLPDLSDFDVIVTHGAAGEYGHGHHKQVGDLIAARYGAKVLRSGYRLGNDCSSRPASAGDYVLELTPAEYSRKLQALDCYDHLMSWGGEEIKTSQALLLEYGTPGQHFGFNLGREPYDLTA